MDPPSPIYLTCFKTTAEVLKPLENTNLNKLGCIFFVIKVDNKFFIVDFFLYLCIMVDIIKQTIEEAISNVENIITNIDSDNLHEKVDMSDDDDWNLVADMGEIESDLKKVLKKLYTLNNGGTL